MRIETIEEKLSKRAQKRLQDETTNAERAYFRQITDSNVALWCDMTAEELFRGNGKLSAGTLLERIGSKIREQFLERYEQQERNEFMKKIENLQEQVDELRDSIDEE